MAALPVSMREYTREVLCDYAEIVDQYDHILQELHDLAANLNIIKKKAKNESAGEYWLKNKGALNITLTHLHRFCED